MTSETDLNLNLSAMSKLRAAFAKKPHEADIMSDDRLVRISAPVKLKAGETRTHLPPRPQVTVPLTPPPARPIRTCDLCGEEASAFVEVENVGLVCETCAESMTQWETAAVEQAEEEARVEALLDDRRARDREAPRADEEEEDARRQQAEDDEDRGTDRYTPDQHEALMREMGEWAERGTGEPPVSEEAGASGPAAMPAPASRPIAEALSAEVIPIMKAEAERAVDQAITQVERAQAAVERVERAGYGGPDGVTRAAEAIAEYIAYIKTQFVGRDEMIEMATLAMIAKMHAVYIGPAGTAKSQVLDVLVRGIEDVLKGSAQGNSFMTPDELIGPISLAEIETNDRYVRKTEGRLAGVQLHILDECFKLTSKSFNFLLRSLNEREIYNPEATRIPLHTCLGASNEYPNDPDLRALRDRFAIKMFVEYVTSEQFLAMMRLKQDDQPEVTVSWSAFERLCAEVDRLEDDDQAIPDRVMELLLDLRTHLGGERVSVSDRLFRWARRILIAKALLDGRGVVSTQDIWCLQHTLWDDQKDRSKVRTAIETLIGKLDQTLQDLEKLIDSVAEGWEKYVQAKQQGGAGDATATGMKVRGETMHKVRDMGNALVQIEGGERMSTEQRAVFERLVGKLDALRSATNPVQGVTVSR